MAAFCMSSYGVVGYLWLITHNKLRFMVYWLMLIRQHGPVCLRFYLSLKEQIQAFTDESSEVSDLYEVIAVSAIKDGYAIVN